MVKVSSVPNFFICPLSSEVMKDPVTLCTGQTYDRSSIQKWFASGHDRCPSTMQVLGTRQLVPNDYLKGLICDWCASNSNHPMARPIKGVTPAPSVGVPVLRQIFAQLQKKSSKDSLKILQNLRIQMKGSEGTKVAMVEAGGVKTICDFIFNSIHLTRSQMTQNDDNLEEALALLILLPSDCITAEADVLPKLVTAISWMLSFRFSSMNVRTRAATLLARILTPFTNSPDQDGVVAMVSASLGVFEGLVQILREESCPRAQEAGLKACLALLQSKENILRGVEAGLVFSIIDYLSASRDGYRCSTSLDRGLTVLELICTTDLGRKTISDHALTIPILAKIIVQESSSQTEKARAVSSLWTLCSQLKKNDADRCIHEALSQEGLSATLLELSRNTSSSATFSPVEVAREQHMVYLKSLLQCKSRTCAQSFLSTQESQCQSRISLACHV